jgi:hypothetical protein
MMDQCRARWFHVSFGCHWLCECSSVANPCGEQLGFIVPVVHVTCKLVHARLTDTAVRGSTQNVS